MTPRYPNALFAKPLINQAIAILQRDQAAAIAIVNPALQPVSEFHKGPGYRTAFPWLILAVDGVTFDEARYPYTRSQDCRLSLVLDVGQFDQEMAQDNAQDYARIVDMVITSADYSDWTTSLAIIHETVPSGLTTTGSIGSVKEVFTVSHRYSLVTASEIPVPILRVTLNFKVVLEED